MEMQGIGDRDIWHPESKWNYNKSGETIELLQLQRLTFCKSSLKIKTRQIIYTLDYKISITNTDWHQKIKFKPDYSDLINAKH